MSLENKSNKRYFNLRVNDIFDELKSENRRLSNELFFANKSLVRIKRFLTKIHEKYNEIIDNEDKQEVNQLKTILENVNESVDQSLDFNELIRNIKKEIEIENSNQMIKEKILKKYKNKSHKSEDNGRKTSDNCNDKDWDEREDHSSDGSEDNEDEESQVLRHKYMKKESIFDPNTNLYKCPKSDCNKGFKVLESLYQHLRVVHKMAKIKDKNYGFIASLNCFDCNTNTYKCPKADCNKEFATKSRIYRHLTIVHSNKPKLLCKEPNCGKLLKNGNNLRLHMKTHSLIPEPKRLMCEQNGCEYRCKTKHEMSQHLRSHSNERPFKCLVLDCDKSFKNPRGLREHAFTHVSEPSLQCQFEGCHLLFRTVWHRKNHMNIVHLGKNSNDRPLKPCDWPGCDYTTRFAHQIKKHKRLHTGEKPYPCDWPACGKRFRLIQQLKDHKNIHNNIKPYVCHWPGCHYRCSDSANLRKHVRTSHNTHLLAKQ